MTLSLYRSIRLAVPSSSRRRAILRLSSQIPLTRLVRRSEGIREEVNSPEFVRRLLATQ